MSKSSLFPRRQPEERVGIFSVLKLVPQVAPCIVGPWHMFLLITRDLLMVAGVRGMTNDKPSREFVIC